MRVALFVTCFNDALYPGTGRAVVRLLERLGHEVEFPLAQTCCGQMHVNTGYYREAVPLANRWLRVFDRFDAVVSPSPSCVGTVHESYPRIAERTGDRRLAASPPTWRRGCTSCRSSSSTCLASRTWGRTSRIG